jgi:expansin (peptidoglycan-binding protein)
MVALVGGNAGDFAEHPAARQRLRPGRVHLQWRRISGPGGDNEQQRGKQGEQTGHGDSWAAVMAPW